MTLRVDQAARLLGISEEAVVAWLQSGVTRSPVPITEEGQRMLGKQEPPPEVIAEMPDLSLSHRVEYLRRDHVRWDTRHERKEHTDDRISDDS